MMATLAVAKETPRDLLSPCPSWDDLSRLALAVLIEIGGEPYSWFGSRARRRQPLWNHWPPPTWQKKRDGHRSWACQFFRGGHQEQTVRERQVVIENPWPLLRGLPLQPVSNHPTISRHTFWLVRLWLVSARVPCPALSCF